MIVDCYTHTWDSPDQLGRCLPASRPGQSTGNHPPAPHSADQKHHLAAAEPVDITFVLGFDSRYLDARIDNDCVAEYVRCHPDRLIGFAGVDPSEPKEAVAELVRARKELGLRGVAVSPAAQDVHPTNSQAMMVYAEAASLSMPVVFHTGVFLAPATKLEYARPHLLDEVARELPDLKIVIGHLGHPWTQETILLLAKHKNVFAETSGILDQPWQAYQTLLSAHQCGVMDKLLLGSGFPHASASECIETLYSINHLVHGTNLPVIPRDALRGIVERDTLDVLGINASVPQATLEPATSLVDDETG